MDTSTTNVFGNEDIQQAFDLLLEAADQAEETGDLQKAISCLQDAVPLIAATDDLASHAELLNNIALLQKRAGNFAGARELLQQAIRLLEASSEDSPLLITLWNNEGFVEREMGNLDEARKYHLKALDRLALQNFIVEALGV